MTYRVQFATHLPPSTLDQLRELADASNAQINDLTDLLLRFSLAKLSVEQVKSWVEKQPSRRGRLAGGLKGSEKAALNALEVLVATPWAGRVFTPEQVASRTGGPPRLALGALRGLLARGLVGCVEGDELDRWGRPEVSRWWLISSPPPAECDQRMIVDVLSDVRRAMGATTWDSVARGQAILEMTRTSGWSREALAMPEGLPLGAGEAPVITDGLEWLARRWPVKL